MTIIDCIFIIMNFNRFDRESVKKNNPWCFCKLQKVS